MASVARQQGAGLARLALQGGAASESEELAALQALELGRWLARLLAFDCSEGLLGPTWRAGHAAQLRGAHFFVAADTFTKRRVGRLTTVEFEDLLYMRTSTWARIFRNLIGSRGRNGAMPSAKRFSCFHN